MMPYPKLSPLQSRLAASFIASVLVLLLYLSVSSHFAYASDTIRPDDRIHKRLSNPYILEGEFDLKTEEISYEARFFGVDRGIIGRVEEQIRGLANNFPDTTNVVPGATPVYYSFSNASLWGPLSAPNSGLPSAASGQRRNTQEFSWLDEKNDSSVDEERELNLKPRQLPTRQVYITLNTCLQPTNPDDKSGSLGPPPQVELYVSQTEKNPGPNKSASTQQMQIAESGFAGITIAATSDVYIGVYAPQAEKYTAGVYSVEVAASIDAPFHSFTRGDPNLFFIDSDSASVLLATKTLSFTTNGTVFEKWMSMKPPYVVFANNQSNSLVRGVQNSYCGLELISQIAGTKQGIRTDMVQTSMTAKTFGPYPKQQFYFKGLQGGSAYSGTLAMNGNSTSSGPGVVGGGGKVWQTMNFTTQSAINCAVIFNLSFCDTVAYAVPSNPNTFPSTTDLAAFYDNMASSQYSNFNKALQQIPCEIPSNGQYSLARNCTDCARDYKAWLCSVTIPRCMDYSADEAWLQARNVVQKFPDNTSLDSSIVSAAQNFMYLSSSRNPNIDQYVQPGPYKEILPCNDLCYSLVQSCPAVMGFGCPEPGQMGFNYSYGLRPNGSLAQMGQITCNYPGAAYNTNGGTAFVVPYVSAVLLAGSLCLVLLLV